jgi:uncharacterized repeat protein (TIGR03803 family)
MKSARILSVVSGILAGGLVAYHAAAGVTLTTLVSFNSTNGSYPSGGLIQANDGNFYGTTTFGGPGAPATNGTVFEMTPSGALSNLFGFSFTNGAAPRAGLVQGADGSFYGTTYNGGTNNAGTLFQLGTNGSLTTLVHLSFAGNSGAYPIAGLIQGADGNFYGTAAIGGTNGGYGTIFELATNGTFSSLHSFSGTNGGASPYAPLIRGSDGSFYGTTYGGGTNGYGAIFQLTTNGAFNVRYSFTGTNDGGNPYGGLVQGTDGNFYGTTFFGGTNGFGAVFRFATNGTLTPLVSFGNTNGANPQAGLLPGADGNFYGTTWSGGAYTNDTGVGYGTVFEVTTNGMLTTLVSFDSTNGAFPEAGLVQGRDGNFYGTTSQGGTNGYGTVFRLSVAPPQPPHFVSVAAMGGTLTLTWCATTGQVCQMLYQTNLNQAAWNNLNNAITATNPTMTTMDTIGPDRQRFYRIVSVP